MIKPYKNRSEGKKVQITDMFDSISNSYDFLNHFLSFGIDHYWRRKVVQFLSERKPERVLDIATGTGDLAIAISKINPKKIIGIDLSKKMLAVGKKKLERKKMTKLIELQWGDAENIPFENNEFDAVTCAFGVRNFEDLEAGIKEMERVLKKNGQLAILEFSKPKLKLIKHLYDFYFNRMLPIIGRWFSESKSAYKYLPESVDAFPNGKVFLTLLKSCGFSEIKQEMLNFGIVSVYIAKKNI